MLTGAVLLFAGGCMKAGPPWPAITEPPTGVHTPGRWVWAELFADNVEAEKAFYGTVFGWQFVSHGTGTNVYTVVRVDGRPIAGIVHFAKPADAATVGSMAGAHVRCRRGPYCGTGSGFRRQGTGTLQAPARAG